MSYALQRWLHETPQEGPWSSLNTQPSPTKSLGQPSSNGGLMRRISHQRRAWENLAPMVDWCDAALTDKELERALFMLGERQQLSRPRGKEGFPIDVFVVFWHLSPRARKVMGFLVRYFLRQQGEAQTGRSEWWIDSILKNSYKHEKLSGTSRRLGESALLHTLAQRGGHGHSVKLKDEKEGGCFGFAPRSWFEHQWEKAEQERPRLTK